LRLLQTMTSMLTITHKLLLLLLLLSTNNTWLCLTKTVYMYIILLISVWFTVIFYEYQKIIFREVMKILYCLFPNSQGIPQDIQNKIRNVENLPLMWSLGHGRHYVFIKYMTVLISIINKHAEDIDFLLKWTFFRQRKPAIKQYFLNW
jgi:hypothetical protein